MVSSSKSHLDLSRKHIEQLTQIGIALSAEKDINKLLEMIVDDAKDLSNADAGTLYILDPEKQQLRFEIMQTDTMNIRLGGTSGEKIDLPDVRLYIDDKPNHSNVCSHVALTDEMVNIPDVYEAEGFDFTGTRNYDESTGYRSKSMLVIPMKNHENDIIGVLQLLNAQDSKTGEVVAFSADFVDLIASLASQAAVALTNAQLIQDLKNLLYAFIKSIAAAIDEKSPYTGGHITRVVNLTMMIAQKINEDDKGKFKDIHFTEEEIEELKLAAWMHDVGKITTPEYVVDKRNKLQTIVDRIALIETRFHHIAKSLESAYFRRIIDRLRHDQSDNSMTDHLLEELNEKLNSLKEELQFIKTCNSPGEFMSDDRIQRIKDIASETYTMDGKEYPYLTDKEVQNLCIRKGSLTEEERKTIENHAAMTLKMLNELPFPKNLSKVPEYAGGHHEKLDGSGYPLGLSGDQLSLQTRIMAIADIFEALTAKDRPYKKPMKLSQAIKIMGFMEKDNHIDSDIFNLFIESQVYLDYSKKEMAPEQVDE